ncbi:nucleotidyltransferase domain-containing protein [Candidatus Woesearchaeota archaeon]|nr:nucleotidyltransferase domain-containing protein [Candidatus Woesearchaeota archaeon]
MSKKIDNGRILTLFFNEPQREFHIREAAKLTGINPMTATKYLEGFAKDGLLSRKNERGFVLYSANTEDRLFKEEKRHYNFIKIIKSGLIEHLEYELNHPESIILFGSFAKAENIPGSDIDIFILGAAKKQIILDKFENRLGAKIQLFVHSKKELNEMKKKSKELVNNIINGAKLSGFIEVV